MDELLVTPIPTPEEIVEAAETVDAAMSVDLSGIIQHLANIESILSITFALLCFIFGLMFIMWVVKLVSSLF